MSGGAGKGGTVRGKRKIVESEPMWFNISIIDFEGLVTLTTIVMSKFKTDSIHIPEEGLSSRSSWLRKDCSFWNNCHEIKTEAPLGKVIAAKQ
jgi:hypothetical protein